MVEIKMIHGVKVYLAIMHYASHSSTVYSFDV